jgi:hypothetical protein
LSCAALSRSAPSRQLGQRKASSQIFNEVIKHSKRFASSVEDEQRWALAARDAIGG